MVTEDYLSFEVAKLLKEKSFNEKCEYCYAYFDDNDIRVFELRPNKNAQDLAENRYPYVTHQMAMKWLREEHNIFMVISPVSGKGYGAILCDVGDFDDFNYIGETDYFFHAEEAVEAGIKYALENLI